MHQANQGPSSSFPYHSVVTWLVDIMPDMCTQTWLTGNRIEGFAKEYRRLKQLNYNRTHQQKKNKQAHGGAHHEGHPAKQA